MRRRTGTLLLVAFVALGGRALCPDGVGSCLKIAAAHHDCCASDAALTTQDCCCKGSRNTAEAQDAARERATQISQAAYAASFVDIVAVADAGGTPLPPGWPGAPHGPPDTLVSHYTALLL